MKPTCFWYVCCWPTFALVHVYVRVCAVVCCRALFCCTLMVAIMSQHWMLQREHGVVSEDPSYRYVPLGAGMWMHLTGASLLPQSVTFQDVKGGLLAEAPGLGKTVELLALILARPRPIAHVGQTTVHSRHTADDVDVENVLATKATLIVAPATIVLQWVDEIARHAPRFDMSRSQPQFFSSLFFLSHLWSLVDSLKVAVYYGVSGDREAMVVKLDDKPGFAALVGGVGAPALAGRIKPALGKEVEVTAVTATFSVTLFHSPPTREALAEFDVVLTGYEWVRADTRYLHNAKTATRSLRHAKRYDVRQSPLVLLDWWRVVLDEAQMIEGKFTAAAQIAACLTTQHRWCVTGTPIQKEINDLYGLFTFLRHPSLEDSVLFRKIVALFDEGQVQPFLKAMRPLFWRHEKHHVESEMGNQRWVMGCACFSGFIACPVQSLKCCVCRFQVCLLNTLSRSRCASRRLSWSITGPSAKNAWTCVGSMNAGPTNVL